MGQAIVTGATSGIGRAIAQALQVAGHEVIGIGRAADALRQLGNEGIHPLQLDITDKRALAAAMGDLQPDILVCNAGMMPPIANFCDLPAGEIERAITVNLTSVLMLTRLVAPGMRERGRGHILFTGSTAGHAPFVNLSVYCATKAAIGGFAQALRLDLAPHGVRVTEIVAGRVETGLYNDLLPADARAAMYANNSAVQPKDLARMVSAVLDMPQHVDVSRFDILPTHQSAAAVVHMKGKNQ